MNEDYDDDDEILDCPACGREYDEIDAEYLICSNCGYDAEEKTLDRRNVNRSMKSYGVDPDVTHRINNDL